MKKIVTPNIPRVVLVEDDHDLRRGLAEYLQLRGFDVTEAASGVEFHRALGRMRYDVAIFDVNLPDVSGFTLARQMAARQGTGIIMLTARSSRQDRLHGYEGGADFYLTKPVDSEELALMTGNLARRVQRESRHEQGFEIAKEAAPSEDPPIWTLDRKRRVLLGPDEVTLNLSGRETMLLEFLARQPQGTVSRADILRMYGEAGSDPTSRRLDVAFGRLRAKSKQAGLELPLQIVHGAGVRLLETIVVI